MHNKIDLLMSVSWLCYRASPQLCSCSELFQGRFHMFCLLEAHQIQSGHPLLGQGFLQFENTKLFISIVMHQAKKYLEGQHKNACSTVNAFNDQVYNRLLVKGNHTVEFLV